MIVKEKIIDKPGAILVPVIHCPGKFIVIPRVIQIHRVPRRPMVPGLLQRRRFQRKW